MDYYIGTVSNAAALAILILAAVIDIRTRRISDSLVLTGAAVGLVLLLFDSQRGLSGGLQGGITAGMIMFLLHKITRDGLGLGDAKLFACIGIYLGVKDTISAMVAAVVLSGIYSLILICISSENKKRELPFAPFILAGSLGVIFF